MFIHNAADAARESAAQAAMQHVQRWCLKRPPAPAKSAFHFSPMPYPLTASAMLPSSHSFSQGFTFGHSLPSLTRPVLLTGDAAGCVRAWEVHSGGGVSSPPPTPSLGALLPLSLLGVHTRLPSAAALQPLQQQQKVGRHSASAAVAVTALALSCDGKWAVSGSEGGQVFIYDLQRALGGGGGADGSKQLAPSGLTGLSEEAPPPGVPPPPLPPCCPISAYLAAA